MISILMYLFLKGIEWGLFCLWLYYLIYGDDNGMLALALMCWYMYAKEISPEYPKN